MIIVGNVVKKGFYLFLLGLTTYGWWKVLGFIKRKLEEVDREG